jgi:hypothetical protein
VVGSVLSRRLLASVIPVETGRDAMAIALLALGLGIIGLVASLVPARRAATIEPMQALRNEYRIQRGWGLGAGDLGNPEARTRIGVSLIFHSLFPKPKSLTPNP